MMIDHPEALTPFIQAAKDPTQAVLQIAQTGEKVLALQCPYLPEELPHSFGLHPVRIMLAPKAPEQSDSIMQTFCCSWVQALLDQALSNEFAHFWGIVFTCNTCDSIQNLPDIWRRSVKEPNADALYSLRFPAVSQGKAAYEFLEAEIKLWQDWLERRTHVSFDRARLEASTRLCNRIRSALRRLWEKASQGQIPYSLLQAAVMGAQILDRNQVADSLEMALEQIEQNRGQENKNSIRLILVGGMLDDLRFLQFFEEHGASCVADDTCAISRVFEENADLDPNDLPDDMIRRYFRRLPCPVRSESAKERARLLLRSITAHRAQGVIFVSYRGCEPHSFDNVILTSTLDTSSIPHLSLEIDPHLGNWGQISTRLEAFLEMFSSGSKAI